MEGECVADGLVVTLNFGPTSEKNLGMHLDPFLYPCKHLTTLNLRVTATGM